MTRKDYKIIANMLGYIQFSNEMFGKDLTNKGVQEGINSILRKTNENYNADIFWEAVANETLGYKGLVA